jgi:replication-associated recombination protein RarA
MGAGYSPKTFNGVDIFEASSSMQKAIRRGLAEEAAYWAILLGNSGYFAMAARRLRVTAHEDVGAANPIGVLFALRAIDDAEAWYYPKATAKDKSPKPRGEWKLGIANACIALANGPHSRDADNLEALVQYDALMQPRAVPDYALDKHTRRGKQKGRDLEHFFQEGAKMSDDKSNADWQKRGEDAFRYAVKHGGLSPSEIQGTAESNAAGKDGAPTLAMFNEDDVEVKKSDDYSKPL